MGDFEHTAEAHAVMAEDQSNQVDDQIVPCPMCEKGFSLHTIEQHASTCGLKTKKAPIEKRTLTNRKAKQTTLLFGGSRSQKIVLDTKKGSSKREGKPTKVAGDVELVGSRPTHNDASSRESKRKRAQTGSTKTTSSRESKTTRTAASSKRPKSRLAPSTSHSNAHQVLLTGKIQAASTDVEEGVESFDDSGEEVLFQGRSPIKNAFQGYDGCKRDSGEGGPSDPTEWDGQPYDDRAGGLNQEDVGDGNNGGSTDDDSGALKYTTLLGEAGEDGFDYSAQFAGPKPGSSAKFTKAKAKRQAAHPHRRKEALITADVGKRAGGGGRQKSLGGKSRLFLASVPSSESHDLDLAGNPRARKIVLIKNF